MYSNPRPPRVPRNTNRSGAAGCLFVLWFAFCGLLAVGVAGVLAWAVISLVQWAVTK